MYLGKTQVKVRWMEASSAFKYLLHLGEAHAKYGKSERDNVESLYSALKRQVLFMWVVLRRAVAGIERK